MISKGISLSETVQCELMRKKKYKNELQFISMLNLHLYVNTFKYSK